MYLRSLKYHITSIVFMPSGGCVCPGNNAVPIFSNLLVEKADSTESFTSQKSSLPSSWNLPREESKKKKRLNPDSNIKEKEKDKDSRISKRLTAHSEFSNGNRKFETRMCNVSIIIVNLTMKRYRPHPRKFENLRKLL